MPEKKNKKSKKRSRKFGGCRGMPWPALVCVMACLGGCQGMPWAAALVSLVECHGLPLWVSWHVHGHYKPRLVACHSWLGGCCGMPIGTTN
jgi:hypothetical protein